MAITKEINVVVKESGLDKVQQDVNRLEQSFEKADDSVKSFKSQLREANQELLKVSQRFGETSKEAIQAAKKVADLKDQMALANDLVKSFNPDQKFKALGASTQLAGTGLQGVTAGMALFGDQSEATEKALLQVQSAMSFSDAISNLSNLGDQWAILKTAITSSTASQKLFTAGTVVASMVQKAFTGSVTTTTVGFKLLRGAIIATGIGALVVGIGMLIANFDEVKSIATKVSKSFRDFGENNKFLWYTLNVMLMGIPALIANFEKLAKGIMPVINSITDFIGVTSEAGRAIDKQKDLAEKSLKQNEAYLKKNEHKLSEARKREIELSQEHYQRIIDGEMTKEESLKILREKYQIDRQKKQEEANKIQAERDREAKEKTKKAIEAENQRLAEIKQKQLDADMKSAQDAVAILDELKKNEETPAQKEQREFEEKKDILEANNLSVEELTRQHLIKIAEIEDEERQKKIDSDKEAKEKKLEEEKKFNDNLLQAEESLKNAKLDAANFTTNLITQLAGKNKAVAIAMLAVEKGLAIAQIVSGAGKAIANASANLAATPAVIGVVPNPMYAVQAAATAKGIAATKISAATSIASILAQSITSAKGLSSGGDVGSGSGSGVSAPQAPSFNLVQGTGRNQIAEGLSKQAPVKAFVVARDMSTGQEMDRNIIKSASL